MDRALKERIIGAAVLVVFVVLVVPVFLDGPADEPAVLTETVALPGQNSQQRTRQTIVLERDRKEPVPTSQVATPATVEKSAPTSAAPAARVPQTVPDAAPQASKEPEPAPLQVTTAKVTTAPPKQAEPAVAQQATTGMWAVQLGSFSKKENADRLAAELRGKGYAAFISQVTNAGTSLHRVRIGPQKDRDSADTVAARLAKEGVKGQVVPHP